MPSAQPAPVSTLPRTPLNILRGDDYISALHEWAAAHRFLPPTADFKQSGPPHIPVFTCKLMLTTSKKHTAEGKASTKQEAKRIAAKNLCNKITA
jgi:dsRNA-specific ribonuclease